MWKILLSILLFILLAFPNNNTAMNKFGLKKVATNIKLANRPKVLATGIMAGHKSQNNFSKQNDGTTGQIISKIVTKNEGLMERGREYYENLKNANTVPSKTNGALANLYGEENWSSQMDKKKLAKFGIEPGNARNIRKMDEMERKEWNHFGGILNIGQNHNQGLIIDDKKVENEIVLMDEIKIIGLISAEIEIGANIGEEMAKNVIKIGEIMEKILEIDVNVKIDSMINENGKNDGIGIQLKFYNGQIGTIENREIKITLLSDKHGNMEMNPVELGKELIRQICGGDECNQPDDFLPQFGANPCSVKPPPELHELDRSLRPMLLKLSSKLNKGYKNGFYVAFDWEVESNLQQIDSGWLPLLKAPLERFERNAPIRFLEFQNVNIDSSKFKNRLHFVIHNGKSSSKNGLQRNEEKNVVYLNAKELEKNNYAIQDTLLDALGVDAGEGLRIEYDRRDKYMPQWYFRRAFAQLNAAYGAENYSIQGQPYVIYDHDYKRIMDKEEVEFWMGTDYANFATRKYEIPVVYDESFREMANQNQKLFEEVYANFAKNSVIQFVVYEKAPMNKNYVRIYRAKKDGEATAFIGRVTKRGPSYQGEPVEFGKNMMSKHTIYHEFMHVAGMQHEHQRADVEQHIGVDREKAQKMLSIDDQFYQINFLPILINLPLHEYNPRSIMHYDLNWEFFETKSEKAMQQKKQEYPSEPDQMDWENLNHFYGVGKGRTQFKVEIDENGQQKIVDDIDGMRRLKK